MNEETEELIDEIYFKRNFEPYWRKEFQYRDNTGMIYYKRIGHRKFDTEQISFLFNYSKKSFISKNEYTGDKTFLFCDSFQLANKLFELTINSPI